MNPFFSIVIPTYNRAHLIKKTIDSVRNQTFSDWELIIVDDGSTDNTKEVVTSIQDERICYVHQENSERSAARNNGIIHAKGEWICFLDSDDYYLSHHLQTFYKLIHDRKLEKSFIASCRMDDLDGKLVKSFNFDACNMHPAKYIFETTNLTPINVCIHKSCFKQDLFLEKFKKAYWEDSHLWIRLAIKCPFYYVNEYTAVLTCHENRSVSSFIDVKRVNDHISMIEDLEENWSELVHKVINRNDFKNYIDRKYRMFLYQTRQNKQLHVSLLIWKKAFLNRPSWYLITEFPKIFFNKLNVGITK